MNEIAAPGEPAATSPADAAPARPGRATHGMLRAAVVLTVALGLFFAPALKPDRQFAFFDNGRMHVPMKRYIAEELRQGRFPSWNPYSGLGTPEVGGMVDEVQHPFNLLLVALPFDLGFKLWVLLSYLVAGLGAWLWARFLGVGPLAALAAGLGFALSGYLVSSSCNMLYLTAMGMLPWIFAATHAFILRPGPGRLALVGLASGFAAASGDPQSWGFAVVLLPVYSLLFVPEVGRTAGLRRGLVSAAACAIAAAPFFLPVAAWIPHSSRGEPFDWIEYDMFNLLPLRLAEFAVPHVLRPTGFTLASELYETYAGNVWSGAFPWVFSEYIGIGTVLLAVVGAAGSWRARWLLAAAAVFAWMAMGSNAGFGQIARTLPVLGSFRYWEKMAVWVNLLVVMVGAMGLERIVADRRSARPLVRVAGVAAGLLLALCAALALRTDDFVSLVQRGDRRGAAEILVGNLGEGLLHAGLVAGLLAVLAYALERGRFPRRGPLLLLLVVVLDVAAVNVRAYVVSPVEWTRPQSSIGDIIRAEPGLQRVVTPYALFPTRVKYSQSLEESWHIGAQSMYAAWNVPYHIGNLETYSGMLPVRFNRFWRRAGRVQQWPGFGLWSFGWLVVPRNLNARDSTAIGKLALTPAADDPSLPVLLMRIPHRERAYLAQTLLAVDRRDAMEFALDPGSTQSDRSVIEGDVPRDYSPPKGTARITRDQSTRVEVAVHADRPALLILNDIFTVGWTAFVDNRPAEILPTNYLARGVWVDSGDHTVVFNYRTPGLREGWLVFAVGAAALGLASIRKRFN